MNSMGLNTNMMRGKVAALCIIFFYFYPVVGCSPLSGNNDGMVGSQAGVSFCEVSSQVFWNDVKGHQAVSSADVNRDGWYDIYFNNHDWNPSNFWLNDGSGSFSDVWETIGIREITWVSQVFRRPHFTPNDCGYFIWHDQEYRWRWKVRWCGGGEPHRFSGRICPVIAKFDQSWLDKFTMQEPVVVGSAVTAELDSESCVVFSGTCSDEISGLDMLIMSQIGLRFDLLVDGRYRPELVFVGGSEDSPREVPFLLGTSDRHACAWGDYNNDGYPDIFIVRGAIAGFLRPPRPGKLDELYRNCGDGTFENTYLQAGFKPNYIRGRGAMWADIDGDGFLDLTIGGRGAPPAFYRNTDGEHFEKAYLKGLPETDGCSFFNWSDINSDGFQDLLLSGCCNGGDCLLLNRGNWEFEDVSRQAGLLVAVRAARKQSAFKVIAALNEGSMMFPADYDNDGDIDIFISSPNKNTRCRLLQNCANMRFKDVAAQAGLPSGGGWLEGQWADYDNDGALDLLLLSDKQDGNTKLLKNNNDGTFTDVSLQANIRLGKCGAAISFDYNNDGFLDIAAAGMSKNGKSKPCPGERNSPVRAKGKKDKHLFRNSGNTNHWIMLELVGTRSNRDGLGTRVKVKVDGRMQMRQMGDFGKGRYSQSLLPIHFGLGASSTVDSIEVHWPSGVVQTLQSVSADQKIRVVEPHS